MAGLEPANEGVKVPCLTAWLHPYVGKRDRDEPDPSPVVGWVKGLEPSTPGTTIRCSNQLSYTHHICCILAPAECFGSGTPEGIRTPDPRLRRPLLYPTELLAHRMEQVTGIEPASPAWKAGALAIVLHLQERLPKHCQLVKHTTGKGDCQDIFVFFADKSEEKYLHVAKSCGIIAKRLRRRSEYAAVSKWS